MATFRRSFSLPGAPDSGDEDSFAAAARPRHARTASLPDPSHPAISHLRTLIAALRSSIHADRRGITDARRIALSLHSLARLLAALDNLLRLPLARGPLLRSIPCADRLLDALLHLADSHGSFRSAALAHKQHLAAVHAAVRRRDAGRLSSAVRDLRRAEKDLTRLSSSARDLAVVPTLAAGLDAEEAEVAELMMEAVAATAEASAAVFQGLAAVSSAAVMAAAFKLKLSSIVEMTLRKLTKRMAEEEVAVEMVAVERLKAAEECIEGLEMGSERVFRTLMNTRVSLLNVLTPLSVVLYL